MGKEYFIPVDLSDDLYRKLEHIAQLEGCSVEELVRRWVSQAVEEPPFQDFPLSEGTAPKGQRGREAVSRRLTDERFHGGAAAGGGSLFGEAAPLTFQNRPPAPKRWTGYGGSTILF